MFDKNVKVIKAIKFAGNYLENGDIVKITFRDGETEIGELQIDELDSIMIKTINNRCIFPRFEFDADFFAIEKASVMEASMWQLKTDTKFQKMLTDIVTQRIVQKNKIEKQIQELQEQL